MHVRKMGQNNQEAFSATVAAPKACAVVYLAIHVQKPDVSADFFLPTWMAQDLYRLITLCKIRRGVVDSSITGRKTMPRVWTVDEYLPRRGGTR